MADKLSQEEIDANLVKRAEAESGGRKRTAGPRIVTSYDFKHPARVNKASYLFQSLARHSRIIRAKRILSEPLI
jgi:flagellar motor switch protein FliM